MEDETKVSESSTKLDSTVPGRSPTGHKQAVDFAQVRTRGLMNTIMDGLGHSFEAANPGWKHKWEYYNPNKTLGEDMVLGAEGLGYRLVDVTEIPGLANARQSSGMIRRGDMVLMACQDELQKALQAQDALAAAEDFQSSKVAYEEQVRDKTKVRTSSGETQNAVPFGTIRKSTEALEIDLGTG